VVLPDGRRIRNGGKVVKNVAGFDLCKLFIGSRGALGVVVEATFKLSPQPQKEIFLGRQFDSLDTAGEMIDVIWDSDLRPSILDLHQLEGKPLTLVLGLSGIAADVDAQLSLANSIGLYDKAELVYDQVIHAEVADTASMPPSQLIHHLKDSTPKTFVARAGNGIVYVPRFDERPKRIPSVLEKRIKVLFDPNGKLPAL
jgi:FAD/FMN-containing dehydrogenase